MADEFLYRFALAFFRVADNKALRPAFMDEFFAKIERQDGMIHEVNTQKQVFTAVYLRYV